MVSVWKRVTSQFLAEMEALMELRLLNKICFKPSWDTVTSSLIPLKQNIQEQHES